MGNFWWNLFSLIKSKTDKLYQVSSILLLPANFPTCHQGNNQVIISKWSTSSSLMLEFRSASYKNPCKPAPDLVYRMAPGWNLLGSSSGTGSSSCIRTFVSLLDLCAFVWLEGQGAVGSEFSLHLRLWCWTNNQQTHLLHLFPLFLFFQESVRIFKKALEMFSTSDKGPTAVAVSAECLYNLGLCYMEEGNLQMVP